MARYEPVETVEPVTERTVVAEEPGWMLLVRIVSLAFGILQTLLILRVVLLLLGADQTNTIVTSILNVTNPFVEPFRGMFRIDRIASGGSLLDIAAIVALIGWTLVEAFIVAVLRLTRRNSSTEVM